MKNEQPTPPAPTQKPNGYCFIVTFYQGSQAGRPLSAGNDSRKGRLVLFDTVEIARQFMPLLGNGRITKWAKDGETAYWPEFDPRGFNRAAIVTGYDPYDTPAQFPGGIRSEAKGLEWTHHVMWSHAFFDCGGNIERQSDGTLVNTALA